VNDSETPIGRTIGRYRILDRLGAGGMGVVYRAYDSRLRREVALKMLPSGSLADENTRKRFRREALLLSRLNHPNIAVVHDFDSDGSTDFLVMELIAGKSLDQLIPEGGLPEAEVAGLGIQLAHGLAAAHAEGIVHRDLKPANVRVLPDGRLKILDFGIGRWLRPQADTTSAELLTETDALSGTVPYMAPELFQGRPADAKSDLYAAGAVLYEMATGRRLFPAAQGMELIHAILNGAVRKPRELRPELSESLERVILRCIARAPEDRHADAAALLDDLGRVQSGAEVARPRGLAARPRWWRAAGILAAVLVVGVAGFFAARLLPFRPTTARRAMLVVLPFRNLSADAEQEYFSDGITEEMIARLGGLDAARLGVIARGSSAGYKGTRKGLAQIGRELGVDYALEGSVRRGPDQVRIAAQLSRVSDQTNLWSDSFDCPRADLWKAQDDVVQRVAQSLAVKLLGNGDSPRDRVRPAAHEAYLRARYAANQRSEAGLGESVELFGEAIRLDATYAPAYAGLAEAHLLLAEYGYAPAQPEVAMARRWAERALALDPGLAPAHTILASIRQDYDWDWRGAEDGFRRALSLEPGYATAHRRYADLLATTGRLERAVEELRLVQELDPRTPQVRADLAACLYFARRYQESAAAYRSALELDSSSVVAALGLALALLRGGDHEQALAACDRAMRLSGAPAEERLAMREAYAKGGVAGFWRFRLDVLLDHAQTGFVSPYDLAVGHATVGENDRAFQWLEKAVTERSKGITGLRIEPAFDGLRKDRRYLQLLRQVRLPEG
jgi:TolB-like protein/tRNA A-37 threonylcarbamoyl transferase component Bud32/Tfp pilus assembly protein PilF